VKALPEYKINLLFCAEKCEKKTEEGRKYLFDDGKKDQPEFAALGPRQHFQRTPQRIEKE
jgi:hypothetical protein